MDLLATVRKEGSRGGRGDFKWSDVQGSSHRENYLGHSLMAPVGRWQKGRDLNWYAKADSDAADGEDPEQRAARERKEEIRKIKEAEEDALAKALGLPVPPRHNANTEPLGDRRDMGKIVKEAAEEENGNGGKGVGYGAFRTRNTAGETSIERMEGSADKENTQLEHALKEYKRRHGEKPRRRSRSRSQSPHHHRRRKRHRHDDRDFERYRHREQPRKSSEERRRRRASRSLSRERPHHGYSRRNYRSRSPYGRPSERFREGQGSDRRREDRS